MLFSVVVLVAALLPYSSASLIASLGSSFSTTEKCYTKQTFVSPKAPLSTKTFYDTLFPAFAVVTTKSTPIKTITPAPTTTTLVLTSTSTATTTNSTITDTFSTTSTIISTVSSFSTITDIITDTSTTTTTFTSTTSVPTSAGFQPVDNTSGDTNAKRKRELIHPHGQLNQRGNSEGQGPCRGKNSMYPGIVDCTVFVREYFTEYFTLVEPTSTTTLPPSTVTVSSTTTITSTSTVAPPDVSTTLSFSTTIYTTTVVEVTTSSTTVTTDTVSATFTSTSYDACSTNNLLGPTILPSGEVIDQVTYLTPSYTTTMSDSAYDCCVSCVTDSLCAATLFLASSSLASYPANSCYLLEASTCSGQTSAGSFSHEPASSAPVQGLVSNGNCGYLTDGGTG